MPKPSVVFGGEGPGSAQRWFRATFPAECLARTGWRTSVCEYVLYPTEEMDDQRLAGWDGLKSGRPFVPDIITLRVMDDVDPLDPDRDPDPTAQAGGIRRAREQGQIVLVDLDDDVWNIPGWSPAATARNQVRPDLPCVDPAVLNANIAAADGVLCTTARIRDVVEEQVPGTKVWVVPNGIDPVMYRWPKPRVPGPLRVGWMGSWSHHLPHLETMVEALDVLNDFDAAFFHFGRIAGDEPTMYRFYAERVPVKSIEWWGWVPFNRTPGVLAKMDVAIIPRVEGPFFEGQSTSSGLQYAAAGVPFIAAPTAEYLALEKDGIGFTADTPAAWRRKIGWLLADDDWRSRVACLGREFVQDYGREATAVRYNEVFKGLLGG